MAMRKLAAEVYTWADIKVSFYSNRRHRSIELSKFSDFKSSDFVLWTQALWKLYCGSFESCVL